MAESVAHKSITVHKKINNHLFKIEISRVANDFFAFGAGPSQHGGWMVAPSVAPSNCPPGLEYLTQIDQLLIKQQIEVLEGKKLKLII